MEDDENSDEENQITSGSEASTEPVSHSRLKQLQLTSLRAKSFSPFSDVTNSPVSILRLTIVQIEH